MRSLTEMTPSPTKPQDIIDSTMGNLGFFDAESYGLTWKVRGLCTKTGKLENVDIFDNRNVYGDIKGSDIYGRCTRRPFSLLPLGLRVSSRSPI